MSAQVLDVFFDPHVGINCYEHFWMGEVLTKLGHRVSLDAKPSVLCVRLFDHLEAHGIPADADRVLQLELELWQLRRGVVAQEFKARDAEEAERRKRSEAIRDKLLSVLTDEEKDKVTIGIKW